MTKSVLMRVLLIIGAVLIVVGIALVGWLNATSDDRNVIKVQLVTGEAQDIQFESLRLVPGQSCEYVIKFGHEKTDTFDVKFDFVEQEEKTLKNFARVKLLSGDETLLDELLANVFENDEFVVPVDMKNRINSEITVVYYLPIDVGNEAKNAEAIFQLLLTAVNE